LADCDWTRLAYLLFALTIFLAIPQLGSPSTDTLASKPPRTATADVDPQAAQREPREQAQTTQHEVAARTSSADSDGSNDRNGASADTSDGAHTGPPIFYRPAPASATPASGTRGRSDPVCKNLEGFPGDRRIAFPLPRKYLDSYEDTWGAPRPQGGHEGTDLMVPTGTAEYAVTDGTIVSVAGANENGWNSLGGYTVMLEAAYSVGPVKEGDLFYYAHLNRESALEVGTKVRVGQTVGYVGDTGQGPEVTRGLFPPHLHFGWYDATGGRSATTSGAMNPYPLLEWIGASGGAVIGGSESSYCEALQTGGPTPSVGGGSWPTPASPGSRPDLYTASNEPGEAVESPERQTGHSSSTAPAQQGGPAPKHSSPGAPKVAAPKADPGPSPPEPPHQVPGAESPSEAPISTPDNDLNEEQNARKDEEDDRGTEPEIAEPEKSPQPPDGQQNSPDDDQYAPGAGAGSDPE
jgi:murein DD-endopeptidase MepM/ murein hydrolase activator NlpD